MGTSSCSDDSLSMIVAVAVRGSSSGSSRRAVRWAVENLISNADRFVLVHVMAPISSIPSPSGNLIPINEMDAGVVSMYRQDMKLKCGEIFLPYKALCKARKMETVVLEDDNPAYALLRYASESRCDTIVLGSSSNFLTRKLKSQDVPSTVLNFVINTCNIYIVSKSKLISKLASSPASAATDSPERMFTQTQLRRCASSNNEQVSSRHSSSLESEVDRSSEASSEVRSDVCSQGSTDRDSFATAVEDNREMLLQNFRSRSGEFQNVEEHSSISSSSGTKQPELQNELEKLRLELRITLELYDRACEDLVHIEQKVQALSSECVEEARKVHVILESEEMLRRAATEQKAKHLEAMKELEEAKRLLAKEFQERQRAELNAHAESLKRQNIIDALFSNDKRYRRYTKDEIEVATNFFSEDEMIGEGGYGKVYKCSLDHTPVAVKILQPDPSDDTKKEDFLREVEILSQLRHPHLVLLLGACPEIGCLIYEYMENGSLEERLFCDDGTPPLPWFVRFQVAFEVACGLMFLHNSDPEPIVHRDLKPGNILLDRNYRSKIGDVGLAKLINTAVPDNVTEYRNSTLAGTLHYMDPEYHRTGTLRPKSDLYAFGIIILQLLTARRPNRLLVTVENAVNNRSFCDLLDKSIADWPVAEAEELARTALKCSRLRCRDRPDLESEVLPVLEKLSSFADTFVKIQKFNFDAPNHYFCPILQEVMDDPYVAADGFTYEHRAIKAWVDKHKISPVTRLMLPNTMLTPNRTLRSAIQEWKTRIPFSSS